VEARTGQTLEDGTPRAERPGAREEARQHLERLLGGP
jgi:hypothetical protein